MFSPGKGRRATISASAPSSGGFIARPHHDASSSNNNNNNATKSGSPTPQKESSPLGTSPTNSDFILKSPANNRKDRTGSVNEAFAHAVKKTHLAMISINQDGVITSCNNAARILFGYPTGGMIGAPVASLMPSSHSGVHQSYIDKYVHTGVSAGAIGAWKVRPAVRFDGEPFDIRISLSVSLNNGNYTFSSLIDPLYETDIKTDDKGKITQCGGSPWLFFGLYRKALIGQPIDTILKHTADWFPVGQRVVMCKNLDGDEFSSLLKVRKEKDGGYLGTFGPAPSLRVTFTMLESGIISECTGESKALLGYKPKSLRGKPITELVPEEELATVALDKKAVLQVHHRNGRTIFVSLRVTKSKDPTGKTLYEALMKGKRSTGVGFKGVSKGKKLRYGGQVLGWYELGPSLGHGMCGPVKRAVHRLTGEEVAIKTLSKERYRELGMQWPPAKISILERIRHPNLVRMFDTITTPDEIIVVMELIDGGEMFEYCERTGALPEVQARVFWRQLVSGVDYLHRMFICHRDIKLDNLVLDYKHNLKLIDFGFAAPFTEKDEMDVFCIPEDHQVLTNQGFMDLDQWLEATAADDSILVAGYDAISKQIVFEKPIRQFVNASETQSMVEFFGDDDSYLVTQDHMVFVGSPPKKVVASSHHHQFAKHVAFAENGVKTTTYQVLPPEFLSSCAIQFLMDHSFPHWVWSLNTDQCNIILRGMFQQSSAVVKTCCAVFRDQVVRLALMSGCCASFSYDNNGGMYSIVLESEEQALRPALSARRQQFTGRTWCFTMPSGLFWVRRVEKDEHGVVRRASRPLVTGNCGSPDYAAPELVASVKYKGPVVDIWAMGVVLYVMLTGYLPFSSPDRVRSLRWDWPPGSTPSESVQKLLTSIFQPAHLRATMDQIVEHPWGMDGFKEPVRMQENAPLSLKDEKLDDEILGEMEDHYGWTREDVVKSLNDHASDQLSMTYHLLEYKKQRDLQPKNPIWKGVVKGARKQNGCSLQ